MGPAMTLMSPRRYSNLGAVGGEVLELISGPYAPIGATAPSALPLLQPRERHHAMRDSISTDLGDDSASTSVIMDSEYVVLDNHTDTVIQSTDQIDHPPPTDAAGATGIRRITTGLTHPTIVERMDIDLTICKTNITSLEMQAIQQPSKLEWMQQELRLAREERQDLETTVDELKNQISELTTKLESGVLALKSFSDVCTFRAADFHTDQQYSTATVRIFYVLIDRTCCPATPCCGHNPRQFRAAFGCA